VVVRYAPQQALIARAALVVGHAGLNTTLETLRLGTPMVVIPITNDQPAIAARLRHLQLAEVIPVHWVTPSRIRTAILTALNSPTSKTRALAAADQMRGCDGLGSAAALVEQALVERRRIVRGEGPGTGSHR
jgi:UDP:flavonoid glycosyltransferase YjiC (YdhE family)